MAQKQSKKGSKRLICPCCGQERNVSKETPLIAMQEAFSDNWICHGDWAERSAQGSFLHWGGMQWACSRCINEARAIAGKHWLQTFCDYEPYLAYFDKTYRCSDCHNDFVFSAKEQQFWYEELKFWVQAYPKQCLACRRRRRAKSEAMRVLQNKQAQLNANDPQQLLEMASLYLATGSLRKATKFVGRARNRAHKQGTLDVFQDHINSLKQEIEASGKQV